MALLAGGVHPTTQKLAEHDRRRGLTVILTTIFLIQAGFFLIIPLLSVHFVDGLGWAAAFLGMVLAVRQFTQQGLTMFGGALADRWGAKPLILTGVLVRALSFMVMGTADSKTLLLLSGILVALGGALFDAPIRASIAALARPEEMQDYYARVGIARNLAQMIGPAVGAFLIGFNFQSVGFGAAGFFMLTFLAVWWGVPSISGALLDDNEGGGNRTVIDRLKLVFTDRPYVLFTALSIGFWFMWVQLALSLPLAAKALSGSNSGVGAFLTVNSLIAVSLQFPTIWVIRRYFKPQQALFAGTAITAIGLGTVAFAQKMPHLYFSAFLFSLGVVLVMPNMQTVAAVMADASSRGAYLGFNALALALGGGLGNMVGGALLDLAETFAMQSLPWLIFCGLGGLTAFGLWWFQRTHPMGQVASSV
ncbi:MAG: MFS transporter [Ardenticatenaceae bacterium]|nr:MFS transporter [Ardenticatenaceae bacterium]